MDMGSWKNQYIDLVETKPGLIYAEGLHDVAPETAAAIRRTQAQYARTFLELGSGSGGHLLDLAELNPAVYCIGFEVRFKRTFRTAEKAEDRGLQNVAVVRCDGRKITQIFSPASVDRVYINFPDPWDKSRWLKNRLLNETLLEQVGGILKPGGSLLYKTDHQGAFRDVAKMIRQSDNFTVVAETEDLYSSPHLQSNIPTEFERLFLSQGLPIHFLEVVRKVGDGPSHPGEG